MTLFEKNLLTELHGHGLKIKTLVWADEWSEDTEEKEFHAVVHHSTDPRDKPWRITFYDPAESGKHRSLVHIDMDDEFEYRDWYPSLEDAFVETLGDYINSDVMRIVDISPLTL